MAKVECEVEEVELENERGITVMGVRVTCPNCFHQTESFGTEGKSIKRCMALMAEECPEFKSNYYVPPYGEEY